VHEAIRHRDPVTGFRHHGFLNIPAATCSIIEGRSAHAALVETNADRLATYLRGIDDDTAAQAPKLFVSYGSCRIDEPIRDLVNLRLLDAA
jgi:hypothetical protein